MLQTKVLNYALKSPQKNLPIYLREMTKCLIFVSLFKKGILCKHLRSVWILNRAEIFMFSRAYILIETLWKLSVQNIISIRKLTCDLKRRLVSAETNGLMLLLLLPPSVTGCSSQLMCPSVFSAWVFSFHPTKTAQLLATVCVLAAIK